MELGGSLVFLGGVLFGLGIFVVLMLDIFI